MTPPDPDIQIHFTQNGCGQYHLSAAQWVNAPIERVFDFFQRPGNLEKLTPEAQKMRIQTPVPEIMEAGTEITYHLKVKGIPLKWVARIESMDAPHEFVDTQLKGPYRKWHHRHMFESQDGGTLVRDEVDYAAPVCRFGHRFFIKPQLVKIFEDRGQKIKKLFS
ncbi:MAG: SRPBCC family protein [Verrucomicrobia bacterium]|nr:SRPBCC family protein [Verrucomicrobiota bacterium]MCH8510085.1 SRPBCC family protein [Kiritimatiellia bacterium]